MNAVLLCSVLFAAQASSPVESTQSAPEVFLPAHLDPAQAFEVPRRAQDEQPFMTAARAEHPELLPAEGSDARELLSPAQTERDAEVFMRAH
ncbi:hypothetical protein G6O69_22760 [Pseudenhygromyxa sp. WMMC2535]|uniref:hypothetical protein n=1 Tax=Pseudenhygromyxa sp. WMMC2535 TaxID=2712867 RepID=UPI001556434D|nr:hypothetical protein [Pseudenhygromyxa sp. WMMC2535]NVB40678.1 hypothetical protein [Pseudenhygromyxa sp. WMMC2535]